MTDECAFEDNRSPDWRLTAGADGVPTQGPERCGYGCQHCYGPLDAKPGVGQYECPWCIARLPDMPKRIIPDTPERATELFHIYYPQPQEDDR